MQGVKNSIIALSEDFSSNYQRTDQKMSSEQLLMQAKQAIAALESGLSIKDANDWLTNFEKSFQAWQVAELLLDDSDSYRFFGVKFLYAKLQKQFVSLEKANAEALSVKIVQKIISVSQENPPPMAFCRYLCLALTALALQMNQPGVVRQILSWLNPVLSSSPHLLLLLLTLLPEEAVNPHYDVSYDIKEAFFEQLDNSAHEVVGFLSNLWPQVAVNTRSKLLKCAENWVDIVKTPPSVFFSSSLFSAMVESLQSPQSDEFDNAVDLLIAIIRRYYDKEPTLILDQVLPIVLMMRSKWTNLIASIQSAGEFTEDLKTPAYSLSRLFAETAEYTIDLYSNLQYNYGQQEMVAQLLECVSFPYDHDIARIPLKFFYELSMLLKAEFTHESHRDRSSGGSSSPSFDQLLSIYTPSYCRLLEIAAQSIALSPEVMLSSASLTDAIKDVRADWKEAVVDCCDVLTGNVCMTTLCAMMEGYIKQMSAGGSLQSVAPWCQIESVLETIQIVAPSVHSNDTTAVPQLISFISSLPKELHHLQVTSIVLLGRFSNWLESNPSYINPAVMKLGNDLSNPSLSNWAASSIMQILRSCGKVPNLPLQEIRSHVATLKAHNALSLDAEVHLLEGLAIACSYLPSPTSETFFRDLVMGIAQDLHGQLQMASPVGAAVIVHQIERITVIIRFYRGNQQSLCAVFGELFPLMQSTLGRYSSSEIVCERICRLYKHAMRSGVDHFSPLLPSMVEHLATQFRSSPLAAFLYASSVCFSTFGLLDKGAHVPLLFQLLWALSETFFNVCPDLSGFEKKPDLVEEYFFLVAKALQYCPAPFVEATNSANMIIQASIGGVTISHREAQKGILLFMEKLVNLVTFWSPGSPHYAAAVQLADHFGGPIVLELFRYLSGSAPIYSIDEPNGSVTDVLWMLRKKFEANFKVKPVAAPKSFIPGQ